MVNAFATGPRRRSAIAITDGVLRTLTPRELAGVLAHDDLRVRGLAWALVRIERVNRGWLACLLPCWGNLEPSRLRTPPPTQEDIARRQARAVQ